MNRFLILVSFLLLVSVIPLRANATTDPVIGVADPPCTSEFGPCAPLVSGALGTSFTFNADGSGGGIRFFEVNPSGPGISSLDIETPVVFPVGSVSCNFSGTGGTSPFSFCTPSTLDGVTDIYFSGCSELCSGLPAGNEFAINLNNTSCDPFDPSAVCDNNGAGGWGAGQAFTAFPNVPKPINPLIPEPSTGSLLALGVLGLLAAKNKKKFGEVLRSL